MAWQNPKTDWVANPKNPDPGDFNRIEGNIDFLKGDIETKKGLIVDALAGVGLETSIGDSHAQIASKITASNQGTKIITPSTANQVITKGFHDGQGYVKGDPNLVSANIKSGVNIFGVIGALIDGSSMKRGTYGSTYRGENEKAIVSGLGYRPTFIYAFTAGTNGSNNDEEDYFVYSQGNSPFPNTNMRIIRWVTQNSWYTTANCIVSTSDGFELETGLWLPSYVNWAAFS